MHLSGGADSVHPCLTLGGVGRCGHVREGLAQVLCEEPCTCGAVCCGAVEKIITESFV